MMNSSGRGFEPHQRHCVVFLSKTLYPLLITGSTQEDPSQNDRKTVDVLSGLIVVQTVRKGYQQTTLGGKEIEWMVHKS